jgi:uncharacterized protein (TIGR01777 family)
MMNKETVLITGANSFIAKHLIPKLANKYHVKLLTRNPKAGNEFAWDLENWTIDERALDDVNYIVHLAGSKLNDGTPLTTERKKLVYDTRIGAANFLCEILKKRNQTLTSFVSASAIGYYGYTDNVMEIDESGEKGAGFAADLSDDWENAADLFQIENVAEHVAKIRVSLVMGNESGIFPMYKDLVLKNPSVVHQQNGGSIPWNHVDDMAGIFAFAVENKLDGVFNSVAPEPASTENLLKILSNELHQSQYEIQPFHGQHLVSKKIQEAGFEFQYPTIEKAIKNLVNN